MAWQWRRRRALLARELRSGEKVLDLGCGSGAFLVALKELGAVGIGVDLSEAALCLARERDPELDVRQIAADGSIPVETGSVDLIWCSEVLEHIADTGYMLTEMRRVLKRDGRVLITVPAFGRLKRTVIALFAFERHFDPLGEHVRFFTAHSLRSALNHYGFDNVQITTFGRVCGFPSSFVARARRQN